MAAQEFSSPGAHMASMSGSSNNHSVVAQHPLQSGGSNVIYASVNKQYDDYLDRESRTSARDRSYDFNERYIKYNYDLYNSAKDYDMYMSNTAIQRQVEDLKKAGLNPILASHLGGAQYKGVNAPYISVNPSSALGSFLNYDSSIYCTDVNSATQKEVAQLNNSSREFIAKYDNFVKMYMQDNGYKISKALQDNDWYIQSELMSLKTSCDKYLDDMHFLNEKDLKQLGFENEKALYDAKKDIDMQYNYLKTTMSKNPTDVAKFLSNFLDIASSFIPGASSVYK